MRYGMIPTRLSERVALWFGRVPAPILDCLLPLLQTRSLMAAVRLGVVDAIGRNARTAAEIAAACRLDPDTLEMLLRVLVSARYLAVRNGRYRLSRRGRRTLLKDARDEARGYVLLNYVQWEFVERLEDVLRTGRGLDFHETMRGGEKWEWYQDGMLNLARAAAPVLARMVPVKAGARTLVDVGGSHGLLGAAICRRHPPLRSIVTELPAAIEQARAAARDAGVDDIVEHRASDVLQDGVPGPADVVLFANILHHFERSEAIRVLRSARDALTRGGTVAIWDFDRPPAGSPSELAADASALYFRLTSTSQLVSADEYVTWLREAGFVRVNAKRSLLAPFQVLLLASPRLPR